MSDNLNVLYLSSEVVPFSKTGGLADVAGALPLALERQGCRVTVATPYYGDMLSGRFAVKPANGPLVSVPVGDEKLGLSVLTLAESAGDVRFLFGANDDLIARAGLYTDPDDGGIYPDNDVRFVLFCRGMLEWFKRVGLRFDIIHCNDWQTAIIPAYLRSLYAAAECFAGTRSILTIHNLAYQGVFPPERFAILGLDPTEFVPMSAFEFFGNANYLKAGIVHADKINTVSPTYAHEIQTDEDLGAGLGGVLQDRSQDLSGILNGIDYDLWNPEIDPLITKPYSAANAVAGKRANKDALLQRSGIPHDRWEKPLIGMISRLADQKGFDLIAEIADELFALDVNWVLLGTGDPRFHTMFKELLARYPDRLQVFLTFDNQLAHLIEAGADMFLMPSRYEPCGLNQMYSLAYGTVPIVRATGGLADTVIDDDSEAGRGTGFAFIEYDANAMLDAIERAVVANADSERWAEIQQRGMQSDFSWDRAAGDYIALYEAALRVDARV